jgi:hypothetical protein
MSEPEDFDARNRPHIPIDMWRETAGYDFPTRAQQRKPLREDYAAHAQQLVDSLAAALPDIPAPGQDMRIDIPGMQRGALIEVETTPPAENSRSKAARLPDVEFVTQDIVVLRSERRDDRTEVALMFVPDTSRQFLQNRITTYGQDPGNARRPDKDRFEALERFVAASVDQLFPNGLTLAAPPCWWELWIREPLARADHVANAARNRGLDVHNDRLIFPDTVVVLVHADGASIHALAVATIGAIAEVRRAAGTIRPFLERGDAVIEQADFTAELASRVLPPPSNAPKVAVLDTGVAAAHPLIAPGLVGAHAYDDAWGTDDHEPDGGHGTGMVGLVLYGDMEAAMNSAGEVALSHAAISMKLLPPPGFPSNEPRSYGFVTQGAVAAVEIEHPNTVQTYCLATSTDEFSAGSPSSWSGALDQIASGSSLGDAGDAPRLANLRPKRLIAVATGNVGGGMRDEVEQARPIEDPAQAWNVLTIGGYTAKETVAPEDAPLTPLVGANELSPFSRGSTSLPDDLTPIKPEVLFEAGNMLVSADGYCGWNPSVSLLTAGSDVEANPLAPIWATSAAAGVAGNFLGRLEAELPDLWPETHRALAVQSALWTAPMRSRLVGRGEHWKTSTAGQRQQILRRYGYGVANVDRAVASAGNSVTLMAQAELQPYARLQPGPAVYQDMHFYDLPWPRDALEALENEIVTMKVVLSYFIEPNLTARAAARPDMYRSFGLRFKMKRRGETDTQFRARVNAAQTVEGGGADPEASYWLLGPNAIAAGSLHCDLWRGRAIQLAGHDAIAIHPVGGWWKSHVGQRRFNDRCRYSLTISIDAPGYAVDMHAELQAQVELKTAELALAAAVVV